MFLGRASSTAVVVFELPQWDSQDFGLITSFSKFPDVRCWPLNCCFQTAFIPVPLCREGGGLGSISFCTFGEGGEWPNFVGLALCSSKITHLLRSIFVLARTRKKSKCFNMVLKQTLHGLYLINYEIHLCILGILITDGSLQVSKTLQGLVNVRDFEQSKHIEIIVFAIC